MRVYVMGVCVCACAWMWVCERGDNQPQSALRVVHTWEKSQSIDVVQHIYTESLTYEKLLPVFFHVLGSVKLAIIGIKVFRERERKRERESKGL